MCFSSGSFITEKPYTVSSTSLLLALESGMQAPRNKVAISATVRENGWRRLRSTAWERMASQGMTAPGIGRVDGTTGRICAASRGLERAAERSTRESVMGDWRFIG